MPSSFHDRCGKPPLTYDLIEDRIVRHSPILWIVIFLLLIIGGCGEGATQQEQADVGSQAPAALALDGALYAFDSTIGRWRPNNGRWYAYTQSRDACATEFGGFPNNPISPPSCFTWLTGEAGPGVDWITTRGPWWVDPNHKQLAGGDGYGFVHVLAFAQVPAALYAPLDLEGTELSFVARRGADFSTVRADSRDGPRKGHVYLWFQTSARTLANCTPNPSIGESCTRQSDYILTGRYDPRFEIDTLANYEGFPVSLKLTAVTPEDWTCLGHGENVKYECAPIKEAIRSVAAVGLLMAPVAPCPTLATGDGGALCNLPLIDSDPGRYFAQGTLSFRDFRIRYPEARTRDARLLAFPAGISTSSWTTPTIAGTFRFETNDGLYLPKPPPGGALRLGLSTSLKPASLESAGPQLYLIKAGTESGLVQDQIRIVGLGEDGKYNRVLFIAPFAPDDTFSIHLLNGRLVFLRNNEALHSEPSPCPSSVDCLLTPFVSQFRTTQLIPVYRYGRF